MFNLLYSILGTPLGWIMWLCYQLTRNYGLSLFLFTLIVRAALFPLALKQQKSTAKMTSLRPMMEQLQEKYKTNKEKLNQEMMALYQKEGYNPMAGCLPTVIQLVILFGLIDVIYRPIKHILRLPADIITAIEEKVLEMGLVPNLSGLNHSQIKAIQSIHENASPFIDLVGQENIDKILSLNLNFLGINLGDTPGWSSFTNIVRGQFDPVIFVPIMAGVAALVMSIISMRNTAATTGDMGAAGASMKSMMYIMPFFSFFIAVSVPAGVGIYWFYSNLLAIVQSLILHRFYNPKEMAEKARIEMEEQRERDRQERIEAKKRAKENREEDSEKAMTQKERDRQKLAEARKRAAEKYGEQYEDVTDDDLK